MPAPCKTMEEWLAQVESKAAGKGHYELEPLPIKPGSPSVIMPGYDVQVLDERGLPVETGQEGNISIRLPLPPGTLPTLWNDDKRYVDSYLAAIEEYLRK